MIQHQGTLRDRAKAIGHEHGRLSAAWAFTDTASEETYAKVLKGIEDGDPEVMDGFRPPSLSGEMADDFGMTDLDRALTTKECFEQGHSASDHDDWDDATAAYNEAASESFWSEIERVCRYQTGAESETADV